MVNANFKILYYTAVPLKPKYLRGISESHQTLPPTKRLTPVDDRTDDSGMDTGSGSAMEEWRCFTKPPPGKL